MSPPAPPQPFCAQAAGDAWQSCCSLWSCCHPGCVISCSLATDSQPQSKVGWRRCGPTPQQILRSTLKSEPWWVSGCLQGKLNFREGSVSLAECPSHLSHVNRSTETPAHALEQLRAEEGTHPCPTAMAAPGHSAQVRPFTL